jgi:hypothetical protein
VAAKAGEARPLRQRDWWRAALVLLRRPRGVFEGLRDGSEEALEARAEPITAVVLLAGVASVLATTTASRLLDDYAYDAWLVFFWAVLAGAMYALAFYWIGGALFYASLSALGSRGDFRRARHLLGLAVAPVALSLFLLWPVRLAVYGGDVFRTGGSDAGTPDRVYRGLVVAFGIWAAVLLVIGVRTVERWTWLRAGAACAFLLALLVVPALVAAFR